MAHSNKLLWQLPNNKKTTTATKAKYIAVK